MKQHVAYLPVDGQEWKNVKIISKAGKNKGKYSDWLNIQHDDGNIVSIDWKTKVKDWYVIEDDNVDELVDKVKDMSIDEDDNTENVLFSIQNHDKSQIDEAKFKEFNSWKKNNVFEEVPFSGQKCVSVRWVYSEKFIDGKSVLKARLVARGFEEIDNFQNDSPTCSKECIRLLLTLLLANNWNCNSIDVKSAFLQGKDIERDVYINPPVEFRNEHSVWKLHKCVYGLNDASRTWYLRVRDELMKLEAKPSHSEPALFYWHYENKLHGLIAIHVDDLCWGGTETFQNSVIEPFKRILEVGKENTASFKYLGLHIEQKHDHISINQDEYLSSINPITISKERMAQKNYLINKDEMKQLRSLIGQLNWIATQTRPDLLFECCDLASSFKNATVANIIQANKVVKKAKESSFIQLARIRNCSTLKLIAYHDASYANLNDGGSQGGYVIFLTDDEGAKLAPIAWQSKRIKRVVKSTLAAERLCLLLKLLKLVFGWLALFKK